jgi:hypothetical protein
MKPSVAARRQRMSERLLRNIFIFGALFFFIILFGMTMNSLSRRPR